MTRLEAMEELRIDPWYERLFAKLSILDEGRIKSFIDDWDHLDYGDFDMKVNRMWLDRDHKPKRAMIIMEILSSLNSRSNSSP